MDKLDKFPAKKFTAGKVILNSGETPESLFYLKKGFVKHYVDSPLGKELIIHIYKSDTVFPLMWGLNDEVPNYNLATLTNCEISLIPKKVFVELLVNNQQELLELNRRLLKAISGLSKRIEILNFQNARQRVVSTLLYLNKHFGDEFHFTHESLASLTGLTRERVSIEMKRLKDQGLVAYKRNTITIVDLSKIEAI
jgi:CRP-like cAMP-binding protein